MSRLAATDPFVYGIIGKELDRQRDGIELIASENFASPAVMEAVGSVLTNKYAEGYPGRRYYGGCDHVDEIEDAARDRACALFGARFANVQPHSGSNANAAVYAALLDPGDTILGMSLDQGGHLSHGSAVNFSGRLYDAQFYEVDPETELIDYDWVCAIAKRLRPRLIIAGASAYPRTIDFARFADIAHEVGAYLMVDMAHIAGLVATGAHPSPVPYADVVTSTTHKTLRGPRGGFVLTNREDIAKKVDKAVFPGLQGGPLMHVIAGKAVAFHEASLPEFDDYIERVVDNAKALGEGLVAGGLRLVSGGTDNHLCLVDVSGAGVTGKDAEKALESVGITVNKNTIPYDQQPPSVASGIRVGSAAATTRGLVRREFVEIGEIIARVVFGRGSEDVLSDARARVSRIAQAHPLYPDLA